MATLATLATLAATAPPELPAARLLPLPGWLNSGPADWQSRWEALHGGVRVERGDWVWPRRGDWMARLDDVVQASAAPLVLVAHSLGCQLVAAWSAHSQHTARVVAAMLLAPPDTERTDLPPNLFNWRPVVRQRLPFASLVVTSSDDPYCESARSAQMAIDWGSATLAIGARGHVNDASGLGDWPEGEAMLSALQARAG